MPKILPVFIVPYSQDLTPRQKCGLWGQSFQSGTDVVQEVQQIFSCILLKEFTTKWSRKNGSSDDGMRCSGWTVIRKRLSEGSHFHFWKWEFCTWFWIKVFLLNSVFPFLVRVSKTASLQMGVSKGMSTFVCECERGMRTGANLNEGQRVVCLPFA